MKTLYKTKTKQLLAITAAILIASIANNTYASDKVVDILPKMTSGNAQQTLDETTHPIMRLTPDKSELVHLDRDAASIIVGNPAHINVIADSPRTLVIVPRELGATHFTILDNNGQVIMQRHVIVASPTKDYLKIKRTCSDDAKNCQNTSVFYCPDMCHEIKINNGEEETTPQEEASSNSDNNNASQTTQSNGSSDNDTFEGNE